MTHYTTSLLITLLTLFTTRVSATNFTAAQQRQERVRGERTYGYSWEEFIEDFVLYAKETAENDEEANNDHLQEWLENLEYIHQHPININTAQRDDLLQLGFLSDTQVDSLLSRRDHYRTGLRSVGELMTVRELSFTDRAWLSLLLSFGPKADNTAALSPKGNNDSTIRTDNTLPNRPKVSAYKPTASCWTAGTHEMSAYAAIPCYQRAGFTTSDDDKNPDAHRFLGSNFSHTLRYRYNWRSRLMYGATVQQDAGEPWGSHGAFPWDYSSVYFYRKNEKTEWAVGDYKLSWGQGLVIGYGGWNMLSSLLSDVRMETTRLRPHTGTDETRFLRGAAATLHFGDQRQWDVTAFGSWRRIDGTVKGMSQANGYDPQVSDTITAWKTDGLHRTLQETQKRDVVTQWTTGGRIGYHNKRVNIGVHVVWRHYNKMYWPAVQLYNIHIMRGQDATTIGTDWTIRGRAWSVQGEAAIDRNAAYALTTTVRWKPIATLRLTANARLFAPDFISPCGQTLQSGSRLQNERGGTFAVNYSGWYRWTVSGGLDFAYHPEPIYRADDASWQMVTMAEVGYRPNAAWNHHLRYKMERHEQNLTGYKDIEGLQAPLLTGRTIQHLRWQSVWTDHDRLTVGFGGNLAVYHSEGSAYDKTEGTITGGGTSLGGLLSARTTVSCTKWLKISAALVGFIADDYTVRCYSSLPQQQGVVTIPSFYGRGFLHTGLLNFPISSHLTLCAQYAIVRYFDRETIGTGVNLIDSPQKTDLSIMAKWKF